MENIRLRFKAVTLFAIAGFVAILGSPSDSRAATTSASATATVVTPMAISKNADLLFGKFVANTGGTVAMATTGTRTAGGAVVLFSQGSTSNAASFAVTGEGAYTYAITLPADGAVTLSSGGNNMAVNSFISNPSGTGTLTAGAQTLLVGGTLTVSNAQAPGSYSGSFNVTVDYN